MSTIEGCGAMLFITLQRTACHNEGGRKGKFYLLTLHAPSSTDTNLTMSIFTGNLHCTLNVTHLAAWVVLRLHSPVDCCLPPGMFQIIAT
jgi:hypothetical protein